jgi:MFS family permease
MLLGVFVRVEARAPDPLLPGALLRADGLAGANVAAAAVTASTSPAMLLCVLELQGTRGLSPLHTGTLFAPFNLAVISGSLAGPRVARTVGPGTAMAGGLAGIGAGVLGLLAAAGGHAAPVWFLPAFVGMGVSLGCASVASTAAGTAAVGAAREGVASALLNTAAQVGAALGIGVLVGLAGVAGQGVAFAGAAAVALAGAATALRASQAPS